MERTIETIIEEAVARGVARALAEQKPPPPQIEKPTLTVAEAAKIVGISTQRMYDLTHMESCDFCLTVGRKRLVLTHKLYAFMERQAEGEVTA